MTNVATAAPRVRKPRAKPERRIRLCVPLNDEGRNAVVRIAVDKDIGDYYLDRIPSDSGTAFQVEEIGGDEVYHVNIDGHKRTCECKGYLRHGHCKHGDGLAKLLELGKVPTLALPAATAA